MLTANQEEFAKKIVEGMSQADAYRAAYDCKRRTDKTVWENASRLMANDKVIARVQELRDQIASKSIMTAQERLEWLSELIGDAETDVNAKLKAVDLMNKMQGEYTQKIEADVKNELTINIELVDE